MSRAALRVLGGAAVVAATLVGSTLPAFAHVSVNPSSATQGGFTKLTFRVPNETADATTFKVQVALPTDQPLGSVSVKPHPGWRFTVARDKLATPITTDDGEVTTYVSGVTWIADSPANAIKPGEFDEFEVSAGPLPEADSMVFKALQTYDDGTIVRWIEPVGADGQEPEHPAPTLKLTPAAAEGASTTTTADAPGVSKADLATKADASDTATKSSVNLALGLGIAGLVVGLLAGAVGALALRRKPTAAASPAREMSTL